MKVLFLTHWFPTEDNKSFGIFIKNHLEAIRSKGVVTDAFVIRITNGKGFFKSNISVKESHTELVIESFFWKFIYVLYPIQNWLVWRSLKKRIASKSYSLIHSNVGHPNGLVGMYFSKKMKIPFVVTEHHTEVDRLCDHFIYGSKLREMYNQASMIMPVSNYLKECLEKYVKNTERIQVVANCIDSSVFKLTKENVQSSSEIIQFVAIGSWDNGRYNFKQPRLLIDSINRAAAQIDKTIVLTHLGNCSIKDELNELVTNSTFVIQYEGVKSPSEINDYLNACDYFLHATTKETFCVVGIEAQKSGAPMIISNVPPIPEIMNPYGAVFVENTVESWTNELIKALQTTYDRKTIADHAKNRFTSDVIGQEIIEVYAKIV